MRGSCRKQWATSLQSTRLHCLSSSPPGPAHHGLLLGAFSSPLPPCLSPQQRVMGHKLPCTSGGIYGKLANMMMSIGFICLKLPPPRSVMRKGVIPVQALYVTMCGPNDQRTVCSSNPGTKGWPQWELPYTSRTWDFYCRHLLG